MDATTRQLLTAALGRAERLCETQEQRRGVKRAAASICDAFALEGPARAQFLTAAETMPRLLGEVAELPGTRGKNLGVAGFEGLTWAMQFKAAFGPFQPCDIGKRVYCNAAGVVQMEGDEQFAKRKGA